MKNLDLLEGDKAGQAARECAQIRCEAMHAHLGGGGGEIDECPNREGVSCGSTAI